MKIHFYRSYQAPHWKNATYIQWFTRAKYVIHSFTASLKVGRYAYQMVIEWQNRNPWARY
ncbi:hypothetical protein ADN00_18770 [Ornatilinea apprima]|uniref:Uncharacterized protein n=1 Tax=Ornatilinea apprima TaxID=1134406 RepID=A0A0P6WK76_9CHLR|nr:hypothetical protein ADN00_18770 [Ornatilinea apprima]